MGSELKERMSRKEDKNSLDNDEEMI